MPDQWDNGNLKPEFNAAAAPPEKQQYATPAPQLDLTPGGTTEQQVHADIEQQKLESEPQSYAEPLSPMNAEAFGKLMQQGNEQNQQQGQGGISDD